jgi:hypothetical protein
MATASPFDALIHEVCVGLGWCGGVVAGEHLHVGDLLPATGIVTADQFVDLVLRAEGVKATRRRRDDKAALRAAFIHHMGGETVDAAAVRSNVG